MTLDKGLSWGIHEVYYDEDGNPNGYTERALSPFGESLEELKNDLLYMLKAFEKPILTPEECTSNKSFTKT
jgi:hypothetical protein